MARGLLIAAPASGSGKTVVTLALLRALSNAGLPVASIKTGPDYIDPAFHAVASGRPCLNLDSWAMRPETLAGLAARAGTGADLVLGEGVMGLFDGGPEGAGSTAELALLTGWPVVLVVDARGMAASAGALLEGFMNHRPAVPVAGVIFNRVGGTGHVRNLRAVCEDLGLPVLVHLGFGKRGDFRTMAARHPALTIIAAHAGIPFYDDLWRYKNAYRNLYVDLSSPYLDEPLVRDTVAAMGPERCLYGTDAPYGFSDDDGYDYGEIKRWIERLPVPARKKDGIFGNTFRAMIET